MMTFFGGLLLGLFLGWLRLRVVAKQLATSTAMSMVFTVHLRGQRICFPV
jgi:hypothetical protein